MNNTEKQKSIRWMDIAITAFMRNEKEILNRIEEEAIQELSDCTGLSIVDLRTGFIEKKREGLITSLRFRKDGINLMVLHSDTGKPQAYISTPIAECKHYTLMNIIGSLIDVGRLLSEKTVCEESGCQNVESNS